MTLTATGGTSPYTYSAYAPETLPTGFSVDASTGVISLAATTVAGTYDLVFLAADSFAGFGGAHHDAQTEVTFVLS